MKEFFPHTRKYIFRGFLAIVPLMLSILAIQFIYVFVDQKAADAIARFTGYRIPGLGLILVIVLLYFLGLLSSHVIGKRLFSILEGIFQKIPLVKTMYHVGQQVSNTLSLPEKQVFKKVVLVTFFEKNSYVIGFVTGMITDKNTGEQLLKVFIPHAPNPISGFLIIIKETETIDPQWSVDEAMRAVISGGIIGPQEIQSRTPLTSS